MFLARSIAAALIMLLPGGALAQTEPVAETPALPVERPTDFPSPEAAPPAVVLDGAAVATQPAGDPPVTLPVPRPPEADMTIAAPPGVDATPPAAMVPAATQAETIARVNEYLNNIRVMSGIFAQIGPDGGRTTGKFYISKPGKLRFQYDPPSTVELVADGRSVAVRDRKLNTQDLYLISQTPLRFLLQERIDLVTDPNVVGVTVDPELISVTMQEDSAIGGSAQIVLMFSATDYSLQQWTITDAQGYQTSVAIYDVNTVDVPNNRLFFIDEMRMAN